MALRFAFILVLLLFAAHTVPAAAAHLEIAHVETQRVIARLPLEQGATFSLEFINSIYEAPVRETFVYEPRDRICLIKVESPSPGVFEYYRLIPDQHGIASLYRPVGEFTLRSHDYEHHRFNVGERTIRLKGLVPDGEAVTVRIGR